MRGLRMSGAVMALVFAGASLGVSGAAWAVSAGGYNPNQQDCTAGSDASNVQAGQTQHGCHNTAVNVESGDASTRYAEVGLDQLPNGYSGTPTPISLGYPGQPNSIHSGCSRSTPTALAVGPEPVAAAAAGPARPAYWIFKTPETTR